MFASKPGSGTFCVRQADGVVRCIGHHKVTYRSPERLEAGGMPKDLMQMSRDLRRGSVRLLHVEVVSKRIRFSTWKMPRRDLWASKS